MEDTGSVVQSSPFRDEGGSDKVGSSGDRGEDLLRKWQDWGQTRCGPWEGKP